MDTTLKEFIFSHKDQLILFNMLDDGETEQTLPYFELVNYKKGDILFHEGDVGDYIGIILSGALEVKKHTEFKGKQVIIASLKEGSFVGEMSLVNDKEPRSATVAAAEDSELLVLSRDSLDSLIEEHPYIGVKILKGLNQVLAIRLRKAVERFASIF